MFLPAARIDRTEIDPEMDNGKYTFVLVIPYDFQKDVLAGNRPEIQLNIDATRMSQAFTGGGYIQEIIMNEVGSFVNRNDPSAPQPVEIVTRNRFNPNLTQAWFGSVMELINNITMLAIILTGAAPDPRTGARDAGTPPGDAGDRLRNHGLQGVVDGAGGHGRCRLLADLRHSRNASGSGGGLRSALHAGRGAAPFRGDFPRNFSGDRRSEHAPARHAADSGADAHGRCFPGA